MILIADSGSTKTSWCYTGINSKPEYFSTSGINPFFRTAEDILSELKSELKPQLPDKVHQIFFYGAGIVNEEKGDVVKSALEKLFPNAEIEVNSDLLAAARATLQNQKGIACILGTGSNSCLYDGQTIVSHVPPLGFILGDEGSGAVLGRKLVADFLKKQMPGNLSKRFIKEFPLDYAKILNRVYREEKPNKFLAGFVPFLKETIEEEYSINLLENAFKEFIERNVASYENYTSVPVCFVGSVAFYFQEQLKNVLEKLQLNSGIILKEPLEKLVEYHLEQNIK
jgi:N-acetylglucosamine kinase-like BadF-type ATPase